MNGHRRTPTNEADAAADHLEDPVKKFTIGSSIPASSFSARALFGQAA